MKRLYRKYFTESSQNRIKYPYEVKYMKKVFSIIIIALMCVLLMASCSISVIMNDAGKVDVSSLDKKGKKQL